jgi:integrase
MRWPIRSSRRIQRMQRTDSLLRNRRCGRSAEELKVFLAHVRSDDLYAMRRVAATTGLRRGETLACRCKDLDLEAGRLSVSQQRVKAGDKVTHGTPKTAKSRRVVALDPVTVAAIRVHRTAQLEQRLLLGAGIRMKDSSSVSRPEHPSTRRVLATLPAPRQRVRLAGNQLHDLRHSHATLALLAEVHPKVVQERLGHSSISVTMDGRLLPRHPCDADDAAAKIAAMVDSL